MKIGVLQTGLVPTGFAETYGEYDVAFRRLMAEVDPDLSIEGWRVVDGVLPADPGEADGWIISGSKHGVYEDHAWIPPLKDFIRAAAARPVPMVGVCFGHQIMAEALGGRAEKWQGGWSLGPTEYTVKARADWMGAAPERLTLHAVHQDQVTALAPDATVIAEAEGCPHAALVYGDINRPYAISIQPHPEFGDAYARDLITHRRGTAFPEGVSDTALSRIGQATDAAWAAEWFRRFFRLHA